MARRNTIVVTVIILALMSVLLSGCLKSEIPITNSTEAPLPFEEKTHPDKLYGIKALAKTSLDEYSPSWSRDGRFVFYMRENKKQNAEREIWKVDAKGNNATFLTGICGACGDVVFSSDRKDIFYIEYKTSAQIKSAVWQIVYNDPELKAQIKNLEEKYAEIEFKSGITENTVNVLVMPKIVDVRGETVAVQVPLEKWLEEGKKYEALDIYVDLNDKKILKVEKLENIGEIKVPAGKDLEEKDDEFIAYTMGIDGENKKKIADLALEKKYVDDGGYIGSTQGLMYDMHSWNPDRTKIFFTKLEETGYTWVWNEKDRKWMRYTAGTEPSIPVVKEDTWKGQKLIAKEHERTAWVWDLKDNALRFIGHLSYGIVSYSAQGEVVWSPDGKYVALPSVELSEAGAVQQIFAINTETGESKRLTSFVGANAWPKWSGDSKKIIYLRMQPKYWWSHYIPDSQKGFDIWMVNFDGSNEKQLTNISNNSEEGWLSPDGSKVIYASWKKDSLGVDETQEIQIWVMNDDGNDKKLLTKVDTGGIESMEWSPDGSKIAFVTWELRRDGLDRDIYVMDVSQSGE